MIFLAGGGACLGPYHPDDITAIQRGITTLRENHDAADIWRIQADTREQAIAAYQRASKPPAHRATTRRRPPA